MPGFCPPQDYVFFADEAGISNDRFTVVGGVCVRKAMIPQIHANIDAFREKHNMKAELKWSKISNQKSLEYQALVEIFFALNNSNHMHFMHSSLIVIKQITGSIITGTEIKVFQSYTTSF